ncbi:MAG: anhydro-N-acetylmuramic acid kinase [Candidatus Thiodiazotropha sp. (ex Myrtea spinifera)]|nr:anhydro-N-acetylmuramic acid kinase [Candidatus Thiodiazotropha sp. (ex Myrtea spinifera)]
MPNESLFIGLISGTSLDGIDAVLIDLSEPIPQLLCSQHTPYAPSLLDRLRVLCQPGNNEIDSLGELDRQVAFAFVDAVQSLLSEAGLSANDITAIGSHGQTIRHRPTVEHPFTLQIGDPNTLSELTGITTVGDFRRRDMAVGGEGAPLVPAFHQAVLQSPHQPRVILNLGGIANITCLPQTGTDPIKGYDTGPANTLLDGWIAGHQSVGFDKNGDWAKAGNSIEVLLLNLLNDPYFSLAPPKSTGTEYFNLSWLNSHLPETPIEPIDVQNTLVELTAITVTNAIEREGFSTADTLVCGGGVHNHYLMGRLQHHLPKGKVRSTAELGLDPDWVEAMAFAWLAKRTLSGLSGNLPSVTGARKAVKLGAIYPA